MINHNLAFEFHAIEFFKENSIALKQSSKPHVSIIIPVYNQLLYTLNCLYSIRRECGDFEIEVVVINDKSTDETAAYLDSIKGLNVITNEVNLGFLKNINKGIKAAKGEYILLLNNDVIVLPNLLQELLEVFETRDNVGAAGAMSIHPSGVMLEAGSVLLSDGQAVNIGREQLTSDPRFNYVKQMDYCTGCCLLLKRFFPDGQLVQLDELFLPAYYEETDLCMHLKHNYNLDTYYQPFAKIIHYESVSYNAEDTERKQNLIEHNRIKFLKKWKRFLEKEPYKAELTLDYLNKDYKGLSILVLEDFLNERSWSDISKWNEEGNKVAILLKNKSRLYEKDIIRLQKKGIEIVYPYRTAKGKMKSYLSLLKKYFKISNMLYTNNTFYKACFYILRQN